MFKGGCAILLVISASACSSPSAPSFANVAGTWSGTFQSTLATSGSSVVAFVMNLTQAGSSVSGTWALSGGIVATGTVSGTTTSNRFSGTFTYNAPAINASACTGTLAVAGNAGGNTVNWTSPGVMGNCNNLPTSITIVAQLR
jgi:hypothetical protein